MICSKCGRELSPNIPQTVNTSTNPELKEEVSNGKLFICECPECGTVNLVQPESFVYHDPEQKILIVLSSALLQSDGLEGYVCRQVKDVGSLMEKVRILEAGLDDIVMELCKYVTAQELNKDVELKFYKMDGPDSDITLTYPENGQMQMVSIGANVYSDCQGIVSRNAILKEKATGLVRVDAAWLSQFIG